MTESEKTILKQLDYKVRIERRKLERGQTLWLIDKLKEIEGME